MEDLKLRALEPEDIDVMFSIENDSKLWRYSNRNEPYSKYTLRKYIEIQSQDISESKQKRFVLSNNDKIIFGFIDLFDFESFHRRAGVGLVILSDFRSQGFGSKGLNLIENHSKLYYNLHILYANIAYENKESIFLFKKMKYDLVGVKKKWNYYDNSFHDECLYQKILD
tara:strand:+ start:200 stop:706 length:507 start_codon:yes stop_codon:yes gene_type:complete